MTWQAVRHYAARVRAIPMNSRAARVATYMFGVGQGLAMMVYAPLIIERFIGQPLTTLIGAIILISAAVCLAAQVRLRWRVEHAALWGLAGGEWAYALIAVELAIEQWPGRAVEAFGYLMLSGFIGQRIISLRALRATVEQAHLRGEIERHLGGEDYTHGHC